MRVQDLRIRVEWAWVVAALLTAGCSTVRRMQPDIPYGGRAVAVAVHPTDGSRIVVASESGGLFRTTNGGTDWKQVSGTGTFWFKDVLYVPGAPGTVVAAADADWRLPSGGGIWRSPDGGSTWARVPVTAPTADCTTDLAAYSLAYEVARDRVWAGTLCGLAFSDDDGASWAYLPAAPGFANEPVYAVLVPAAGHLKILTDVGVKVSSDGGATWRSSGSGLPPDLSASVHNALAASPLDDRHLYWAFNHLVWDAGAGRWVWWLSLYRSVDDGASWSPLIDVPGRTREPFVSATARSPSRSTYELYFSDGGCGFKRATVTHGATPALSEWTTLAARCDAADVGFASDGRTPLLLATDGGLQLTADGGLTWRFTGGGAHGYNALQVTEVTGQLHADRASSDLYFATQDNSIWASPDMGATWSANVGAEGFYLGIWRTPLPEADTRITGVHCHECRNFIAGRLLAGFTDFLNPPNSNGNPRLVAPASYVQTVAEPGYTGSVYALTTNTGMRWTTR